MNNVMLYFFNILRNLFKKIIRNLNKVAIFMRVIISMNKNIIYIYIYINRNIYFSFVDWMDFWILVKETKYIIVLHHVFELEIDIIFTYSQSPNFKYHLTYKNPRKYK